MSVSAQTTEYRVKEVDFCCRLGVGFFSMLFSCFLFLPFLMCPSFKQIADDMLNGKPLSLLTEMVVTGQVWLLSLNCALLLAIVLTLLKMKRLLKAVVISCACALLSFLLFLLVMYAFFLPLFDIPKGLGSATG